MKELVNSVKTYAIQKEWFLLALSFLSFVLPLNKKIVSYGVGFLFLSLIFNHSKKKNKIPFLLLILLFLFFFHVFWLFGVDDKTIGFKELETKFSFLLFPVFAIFSKRISSKDLQNIFSLFVLGIVTFAIVTMSVGVVGWINTGNPNRIVYWRLAQYFHPSYLGFYSSIAIGYVSLKHLSGSIFISKFIHYFTLILLSVYIILLTSKAAIIVLLVIIFLGLFWSVKKMVRFEIKSFVFLFLIFIISVVGFINPEFKDRISEFLNVTNTEIVLDIPKEINPVEKTIGSEVPKRKIANTSTEIRLLTWSASLEVIKENPMGVGTGEVVTKLVEVYKQREESFVLDKRYNSHNQYLQFGVEFGVIGFITTLFLILFGLVKGFIDKNYLLLIVISFIGFNMLFESFFELQSGVVSVCFLLYIVSINDNTNFKGLKFFRN